MYGDDSRHIELHNDICNMQTCDKYFLVLHQHSILKKDKIQEEEKIRNKSINPNTNAYATLHTTQFVGHARYCVPSHIDETLTSMAVIYINFHFTENLCI